MISIFNCDSLWCCFFFSKVGAPRFGTSFWDKLKIGFKIDDTILFYMVLVPVVLVVRLKNWNFLVYIYFIRFWNWFEWEVIILFISFLVLLYLKIFEIFLSIIGKKLLKLFWTDLFVLNVFVIYIYSLLIRLN